MEVIICEDNPKQLEEITSAISNYSLMENNGINVALSTTDPLEVLEYAKENKVDCYFLDIDLNNDMTGIKLGSEIRKNDPLCSIIFVTTHSEMTYLTFMYKVAALDFIIKDDNEMLKERILSTLKEAFRRYSQIGKSEDTNKVHLKIGERTRNIDHKDIYFFESSVNLHKIILHLENEQIEFYGKLKDYENLDGNFYRCHKSFIVNKQHIAEVNSKEREILMTNGEICYASNRLIKGINNKNLQENR